MKILEVKNLSKNFGGLLAINGVDINVNKGEVLGLIGPNGAGKTTLFNVITGYYHASNGKIIFKGKDITSYKPHKTAQLGIGRTFQANVLFLRATVLENVLAGFHVHFMASEWAAFLHTRYARREEQATKQKAIDILDFLGLSGLHDQLAGSLPHGHQRALSVAMAMAVNPELLLLDEPVTGMNPQETKQMIEIIRNIRERGITIVVVEHDMRAVMALSDRIVVLNYGQKIAEGSPEEVRRNEDVVKIYLGDKEDVT